MRILLVTEKFPDPIHTGAIVRTARMRGLSRADTTRRRTYHG